MRITALEIGPGKSSVLRKLINKIGENNLKIVCTDGDFSYDEELGMNADIKHVNQMLQQICVNVRTLNSPISA